MALHPALLILAAALYFISFWCFGASDGIGGRTALASGYVFNVAALILAAAVAISWVFAH